MKTIVSVIIPVYNAEDYLRECLESVLKSSYKSLDIILVDDGSTDSSGEICNEYKNRFDFIKVIHQENKGVSEARNIGLKNASGEYITFVDADDTIYPNALYSLLKKAIETDADMTIGKISESETLPVGSLKNKDLLKFSLEDRSIAFYACRILYKKDFVKDLKFEEGRTRSEDSYFIFQCALKLPNVAVLDEVVYKYNNNLQSATKVDFTNKNHDDILYFLGEKGKIITKHFPEYKNLYYNLIVRVNMQLLQNMLLHTNENYEKREWRALREFGKYKKYFLSNVEHNFKMFFILKYHLYFPAKLIWKCKDFLKRKK
ncbi:MAG: glycosyltransferase [Clostridia bacterium]|nr:glycosyltransferase [Clostridia bacterium]